MELKYIKHIYIADGGNGSDKNCTGADAYDVIVKVTLGTVVIDAETKTKMFEITEHGQTKILLHGGRGGKGNMFFTSATQQTPDYAQPGQEGIEAWKILELKVLADVGLVGFPNAGKSTLLSVVSAAKPEIANYPFPTLTPNLGIVKYRDDRSFVMADIPGIIENAHLGKGLGTRFLRHIERNSMLLFLIPCDSEDITKEYQILLNELGQYNPELLDKPRLLAITKIDIADAEWTSLIEPELPKDLPHIFISAAAHKGIEELKDMIWKKLQE